MRRVMVSPSSPRDHSSRHTARPPTDRIVGASHGKDPASRVASPVATTAWAPSPMGSSQPMRWRACHACHSSTAPAATTADSAGATSLA